MATSLGRGGRHHHAGKGRARRNGFRSEGCRLGDHGAARHTFASFLVEQGAHPKEMAEVMGHSSVQITLDRYSHIMPHLRDALTARFDEAYRDVRAEEPETASVVQLR